MKATVLHSYLGTVVGVRRGVENGPAGGGDLDFSRRGGESQFTKPRSEEKTK